MRAKDNLRSAAEVLVDQLRIHGVRHVFCVPGESYLAVLDAFHDSDLTVTVCRQEAGACMMAEAIGKATGRPGVCFVTRGPGATNASPRHPYRAAGFDPADHVRRPGRARHARARGLSGARLSRRVRLDDQMDDRDRRSGAGAGNRLARLLHRGQRAAGTGRRRHPGGHAGRAHRRCRRAALCADRDLAGAGRRWRNSREMLGAARAPIMLLGGSRWSQEACDRVGRFAQKYALPVGDDLPPRLICSTRRILVTPATSASGPIRNCSSASNPPTSSS